MRLLVILVILGLGFNVHSQDTTRTYVIMDMNFTSPLYLEIDSLTKNETFPNLDTISLYNNVLDFESNTYIWKIFIDTISAGYSASIIVRSWDRTIPLYQQDLSNKMTSHIELLQRSNFNFETRKPYFIPYGSEEWYALNHPVSSIELIDVQGTIIYFKE